MYVPLIGPASGQSDERIVSSSAPPLLPLYGDYLYVNSTVGATVPSKARFHGDKLNLFFFPGSSSALACQPLDTPTSQQRPRLYRSLCDRSLEEQRLEASRQLEAARATARDSVISPEVDRGDRCVDNWRAPFRLSISDWLSMRLPSVCFASRQMKRFFDMMFRFARFLAGFLVQVNEARRRLPSRPVCAHACCAFVASL